MRCSSNDLGPGLALAALALMALIPGSGLAQAGPYDRLRPEQASVARGRTVYAGQCINCHGLDARGTPDGPDLIRSVVVLQVSEGTGIGAAIRNLTGHPPGLSDSELQDLAHFLREQVEATARNRNPTTPPDVLTGDADAGRAWFTGGGGCTACHSAEGDLRGIGRTNPLSLQQRFLFPRSGGGVPTPVRVTPPDGPPVSGTLEFLNSFFVSLRDDGGEYHSFRRSPAMSVEIEDPYQAHWDLLERITDEELHDVVTYLETLK